MKRIHTLLIVPTFYFCFLWPSDAVEGDRPREFWLKERIERQIRLSTKVSMLEDKKDWLTYAEQTQLLSAYRNLAQFYAERGELEQSKIYLLKSITFAEALGKPYLCINGDEWYSLREAYADMSALNIQDGNYSSAKSYLKLGLCVKKTPDRRSDLTELMLADIALIALLQGEDDERKNYWSRALEMFKENHRHEERLSSSYSIEQFLWRSQTLTWSGKIKEAQELTNRALSLQRSLIGFVSADTWRLFGENYSGRDVLKRDDYFRKEFESSMIEFGETSRRSTQVLSRHAYFLATQSDFKCSLACLDRGLYLLKGSSEGTERNVANYERALVEVDAVLRRIKGEPPRQRNIIRPNLRDTTRAINQEGTGFVCTGQQDFLSGCDLSNPKQRCIHEEKDCDGLINVIRKEK